MTTSLQCLMDSLDFRAKDTLIYMNKQAVNDEYAKTPGVGR